MPVIARPLLPLSSRASTDSCNILFSFRTMISGALSSNNLLSLLFRLITLLYKSFKSDVANLPPSSGTSGLKSGGRTGRTLSIIHSGLLPDLMKDSINFKRFTFLLFLACDLVFAISSFKSSKVFFNSISCKSSIIASAPMPTFMSEPYSAMAC